MEEGKIVNFAEAAKQNAEKTKTEEKRLRLDIIVPHWKEPWSVCRYLFESLEWQIGINFDDLRVIVVNDGMHEPYEDIDELPKFPFEVVILKKEHEGVSAARNYGMDYTDADYFMLCDSDDGFLSALGLQMVFQQMKLGFDYLVTPFIEETRDIAGNWAIIRHDDDLTFMHGKAYRTAFMREHNIRFDPAMTIHEDGYFNMLFYTTAKHDGMLRSTKVPFYLWRWNENSTVRTNREDFVLRTYPQLMQTRVGISRELKSRGYEEEYKASTAMTVLNSYYDFQKPRYHMAKNARYLKEAEKAFKAFWFEFKKDFYQNTNEFVGKVAQEARNNARENGLLIENETLREFLNRIDTSVK
jgi:glycosyltransferase involved in cell wall biosynthesis